MDILLALTGSVAAAATNVINTINTISGENYDYAFIGLVFVLAGLVKGLTGMGLPTVAVALLTLKMTPMEAAALLIVPSSLTNVWQLLDGPELYPLWRRLRTMLAAVCAGTAVSAYVLSGAASAWSICVLGLTLSGYGLLGLTSLRWHVAPRSERWMAPLAGAFTGLLAGTTGVFVMPVAPYLQALELDKDNLVQAMGLAFTVATLALAITLVCRGDWHPAAAAASFLAMLPASAGMVLGQWLRDRMRPALFRRCFFASLLLLGAHLCQRALMA